MTSLVGLFVLVGAHGQVGYGLPSSVSNVQFRTVSTGTDATKNRPGLFLFNEPTAWGSYWNENHRGPAPVLEPGFFQKWRLLAIHAGNRPTGGYSLGVQKIVRRIDRATIYAIESTPPRNSYNTQALTSPWILLQVERGAFDFVLQTGRFAGYGGAQSLPPGSTVKVGGATVTFGPGYGGCDRCNHRGRDDCRCGRGGNCDCRG